MPLHEWNTGQTQEKLPKKVAQNPRVQDTLKKTLEY